MISHLYFVPCGLREMFATFILFVPPNQICKVGKKDSTVTICKWTNQGLKQWNLLTRVTQLKSARCEVHTGFCIWIPVFVILQCLHTLEKPSKLKAVILRCS